MKARNKNVFHNILVLFLGIIYFSFLIVFQSSVNTTLPNDSKLVETLIFMKPIIVSIIGGITVSISINNSVKSRLFWFLLYAVFSAIFRLFIVSDGLWLFNIPIDLIADLIVVVIIAGTSIFLNKIIANHVLAVCIGSFVATIFLTIYTNKNIIFFDHTYFEWSTIFSDYTFTVIGIIFVSFLLLVPYIIKYKERKDS